MRELAAQLGDLGVDPAPVGLDLGLTGTAAADAAALRADPATGLAGQVATPAAQPLLHVAQLGELDLGLALPRLRVLGEDVEDQRGAVDDLDLDAVLEVPQLAGRELAVADHRVRAGRLDDLAQPVDLAAADVRRRVGLLAALVERVEHLGAGGLGEQGELGHRVLGVLDGAFGPHADQHDPLEAQLAVLDLADVLELGGQAGDPAKRMTLCEVPIPRTVARALGVLGVGLDVPALGLQQGVVQVDVVGVVCVVGAVDRPHAVGLELMCVRHIHQRNAVAPGPIPGTRRSSHAGVPAASRLGEPLPLRDDHRRTCEQNPPGPRST